MVELRQRLVETWTEFQHNILDEAIEQWRSRLRNCVRADGGYRAFAAKGDRSSSYTVAVVVRFIQ